MTVISKVLFDYAVNTQNCTNVVHPWAKNCHHAWRIAYGKTLIGSIKYFGIFYVITALLKYKKLDKEFLKKHLQCYARTCFCGFLVGSGFLIYACTIRKIFGKFDYYTACLLPGILAGFGIIFGTKEKKEFISVAFGEMVVEIWFRLFDYWRILKRNLVRETLTFMVLNGYLMYLMRQEQCKEYDKRIQTFWIFKPPGYNQPNEKLPCPHKEPCMKYILQGTKTYFQFGCAISLLGILVKNLSTIRKSPRVLGKLIFKLSNLNLGLFAASYAGLYRATTCYLCNYYNKDDPRNTFLGGFVAGGVYGLIPAFPALCSVLTRIFHIHLVRIQDEKLHYHLPLTELWFAISMGFVYHSKLFFPGMVPKSTNFVVSSVTNGLSDLVVTSVHHHIDPILGIIRN